MDFILEFVYSMIPFEMTFENEMFNFIILIIAWYFAMAMFAMFVRFIFSIASGVSRPNKLF